MDEKVWECLSIAVNMKWIFKAVTDTQDRLFFILSLKWNLRVCKSTENLKKHHDDSVSNLQVKH